MGSCHLAHSFGKFVALKKPKVCVRARLLTLIIVIKIRLHIAKAVHQGSTWKNVLIVLKLFFIRYVLAH